MTTLQNYAIFLEEVRGNFDGAELMYNRCRLAPTPSNPTFCCQARLLWTHYHGLRPVHGHTLIVCFVEVVKNKSPPLPAPH